MLQLRERIDLSPSLLEFKFKNRFLNSLFGNLAFYFLRRILFKYTIIRRIMERRTIMNERIIEYPYVFWQLSRHPNVVTVLDIGSNFSLLPIQLATLGYKVTGLDLYDSGDTYHPNYNQVVSDLFDNELPSNSFDCVVSVSTIEHMGFGEFGDKVIDNADVCAFEIVYRLLKPRGIAIITLPVLDKSNYWFDKTTFFSMERIRLITKDFEIIDQRLLGKKGQWVKDAEIEYFSEMDEIGTYNVHLLTLRKPLSPRADQIPC